MPEVTEVTQPTGAGAVYTGNSADPRNQIAQAQQAVANATTLVEQVEVKAAEVTETADQAITTVNAAIGNASAAAQAAAQHADTAQAAAGAVPALQLELAAVASGHIGVQTLAQLQAITDKPVKSIAEVLNDPTTANNGYYSYQVGGWVKSAYDPIERAKEADAAQFAGAGMVLSTNGGLNFVDAKGQPIAFTTPDGRVFLPTLQGYAQVAQVANLIPLGTLMQLDQYGFLNAVDAKGQPIILSTPDGRLYLPTLQGYASKAELASAVSAVSASQFAGMYGVIVLGGQSNARGVGTVDPISTVQPYQNYRINSSKVTDRPAYSSSAADVGYAKTALVPLIEIGDESPVSGTVNEFARRQIARRVSSSTMRFVGLNWGNGGTKISDLLKDDPPTFWYNKMEVALADIVALIPSQYQKRVLAFVYVQGEADNADFTSYADYYARQSLLFRDFCKSVYDQTGYIYDGCMVTYQTASHRFYLSSPSQDNYVGVPNVARAQLQLSKDHPRIVVSHPDYFIPHATADVHYTNVGSNLAAAYYAKAIDAWYAGKKFKALQPARFDWQSSYVDVYFDADIYPLALDTTLVPMTNNYGFDIWQTVAVSPTYPEGLQLVTGAITSVVIRDYNCVRINLSANYPSGTLLTYAWGRATDPKASGGNNSGARGNLRDSDPDRYVNPLGNTIQLFNWCVIFDYARV